MVWLGISLVVLMFIVFVHSTEKVKYGEFNETSLWLLSFGIYVWGQGLLLAPFWLLFGMACIFWLTPNQAFAIYVWFHMIRALGEFFLISLSEYRGLSDLIMAHEEKISKQERTQLYMILLIIIMVGGGILLALR